MNKSKTSPKKNSFKVYDLEVQRDDYLGDGFVGYTKNEKARDGYDQWIVPNSVRTYNAARDWIYVRWLNHQPIVQYRISNSRI